MVKKGRKAKVKKVVEKKVKVAKAEIEPTTYSDDWDNQTGEYIERKLA